MDTTQAAETTDEIRAFSKVIAIPGTLKAIAGDPDDDAVLECAVIGQAQYLVSGDRHLLGVGNYQGFQFGKAAELLAVFRAHQPLESLLLLEARPCAGESDAEIVAGAWNFERINRRYARPLKVLAERPGGALRNDAAAKVLLRWAAAEREAGLDAVTNDPLLPGRVLPSDYLGQQALVAVRKDRRRVEVLRDAGRQLCTFNPEKTDAGRA